MITWEEYLKEAFGVESDKDIIDPDDKKLYEEDKRYFEAADLVIIEIEINLYNLKLLWLY